MRTLPDVTGDPDTGRETYELKPGGGSCGRERRPVQIAVEWQLHI